MNKTWLATYDWVRNEYADEVTTGEELIIRTTNNQSRMYMYGIAKEERERNQ